METIQINYDHCRKIKKFLINSKKILLIVGENIALSPINAIDYTVEWLLIKNFDLIDYVLHKFNWLDENRDKMKLMMATKKGSRCCGIHLENDSNLKKDLFKIIPTKLVEHERQIFDMFEYLELKEKTIFEKFKDISTLYEKHCKEITGWSKEKFISLSKYITSVNDNIQRSKEQLIDFIVIGYQQDLIKKRWHHCLVKIRHKLKLAIIYRCFGNSLDGTYTRLEKSSNNGFQYRCWSSQKSDSQNYKFECKIPTCKQIEERTDQKSSKSKQLTTEQTSDTKHVTKCRFIVEKQIGILKNKKALDNIRNSEASHIVIDYRNCCAMINFDFKPSCSDGVNAGKIVKRILKKIEKKQNNLEFLLGKQLDTKEIVPINFSEIDDFPVLKRKAMQNKFFLGSFQLRQAKNYMSDLTENPTAFTRGKKKIINSQSENHIDSFKNSSKHTFSAVFLVRFSSDSSLLHDESDENRSEIKKSKEIGQHVTNKYKLDKKQNNDSMKFICKIKKSKNDQKTENSGSFVLLSINIKDFENHVPKWSAIIEYHGLKDVYILAREVWINCIIEYKERPFERDMIYQLSLYESEVEYFVKYMLRFRTNFFKKENDMIKIYSCYSEKCAQCKLSIIPEIRFIKKPTYVYIQSINNNIYVEDLPKIITIENYTKRN
ncbi:hypothetical protein BpHYR1_017795 [Brachionus plicatilis]|uniref:Uncharacterized protein n=1 Tax=Brachionus plicatilis TaxID=10195 RepID=A0A3M7P6G4_BRAPC|nr:hypothetical protein BpHYR1_017795 [Brachionus plicatilis]